MIERVPPRLLHPGNDFFLDYVAANPAALRFFEHVPSAIEAARDARLSSDYPRADLVSHLRQYNTRLHPSEATLMNIDRMLDPSTLCVIGGQQAGFLGGPLLTVYKILSVLRAASSLSDRLQTSVIPIFWLASEDHDFTEINRVRILDESGDLRTISFDWDDRGCPIEDLPITSDIRRAMDEALAIIPETQAMVRKLFLPDPSDDYASWHARIWSRLFGEQGLVLVEPRAIRQMAGPFFTRALAEAEQIAALLAQSTRDLEAARYPVPLGPTVAGRLFVFSENGRRTRVVDPSDHIGRAGAQPHSYSPDALLRPLLADSLFPTIASILGPSEIAYHAMLRPLYRLFGVSQPLLYPRHGYTLITARQGALLERCNVGISDVLSDRFDPAAVAEALASPALLELFAERRTAVESELALLAEPLSELDPGLPTRLRQTTDRVDQQLAQLQQRAMRTELARRGISVRELRRLAAEILPTGKPQERVLSLLHIAAQHGLSWISALDPISPPGDYAHNIAKVGESNV